MKNFKRILSMLLLLSMVLSMLPAMNLTASAATYSKATSIAVGDKVVFVCESAEMELSSISTTSTKYGIGTAYTTAPAGLMVFEVVEGYSSGTYAFKNGDNYLYWTSGNSLNVNATLSAKTSWTVSFTGGNASVYNSSDETRYIRWNSTSPRFACYTSGQTDIQIYKQSGGTVTPTSYAVSWSTSGEGSGTVTSTSGASGATVTSGTSVTMTITPDSGSTVESVTVNGTAQSVEESGGSITFTVSAATTVAITWGKESTFTAITTGNYVIAANVGGTYYAMSEAIDGKIASKVITVTDGTVNSADALGYTYTVTVTDSTCTIYNGSQYVAYASSANLKASDTAYDWSISQGTNGTYRLIATTATARGLSFRASTDTTDYNVFGAYSLSNISATSTAYYDIELIPVDTVPGSSVDTFVKVESTEALGKGYYLIVYEAENMIFDASLETLNAVNNYQTVTIADKTIVTSLDYAFTIDTTAGLTASTIKSSGGYYIGRNNASAGLDANKTTGYTNTLSIDSSGNAIITGLGGYVLQFNTTSGQDRFRYYNNTQKTVALYKCTTSIPGAANVVVSWSTEGTGDGTVTAVSADGASITSGASIPAGTSVTMTVTPNEGYSVASVTVNGTDYAVDAAGGDVTFTAEENTTVVVTWEEIVLESVDVDLKIISGAGKIEAYRDGTLVGSFEGVGGTSGKLTETVYVDEVLKLVVWPGEGQRLISIENGGRRVLKETWTWDEALGAYTCEVTVDEGSEAMRFSFLPRKSDIGVVAELATSFEPGKYVITGTTFDPTAGNTFNTNDTYLLFGCDDLLASGVDTIGDKAAALNLYDAGVTIQTSTPYIMEGLTKGSLYDIQPYDVDGVTYYTMQICGMTEVRYLEAQDKNQLRAVDTVSNYALWSITVGTDGVSTITNKGTGRVLKFNTVNENYQFRAYKDDTYHEAADGYHLPVLYKATVTGYQVNYSKEGLGTITAYNSTTSASVASGSIQNEDSTIVFSFAPAQYNTLESVYVNGEDYTEQVENGILTIDALTGNLEVHAVFSTIVISNNITVNYYVNRELQETVTLTDLSTFSYLADLSRSVTIDGTAYTYADLTFEYSENATSGAMYAGVNDTIHIEDGDVINLYFLTSPVTLTKTAKETTETSTSKTTLGGDDSASNFTDANNQDPNGNVKQTYEITLNAQSNNWADGYTTGGNTDIIVILDNSLSMYEDNDGKTNRAITLSALNNFLKIVFEESDANNRVALLTYHTMAYVHRSDKTAMVGSSLDSSFTYSNTFMTSRSTIYDLAKAAMVEDDVDAALDYDGGTTNPESAFVLAEQVAALRESGTTRDLIVIMFTDGKPTSRLDSSYNYTWDPYTSGGYYYKGGNVTSSREFKEARSAGVTLKNFIKAYPNCSSTIYSIALLNPLEASGYEDSYYTLVKYLYGAGSAARNWTNSSNYGNIIGRVSTSSNWSKVEGFSDVYLPVYGSAFDVEDELADLFESIAYTVVEGSYVSINGALTDVIPPQFALTEESKTALEAAGWTITTGTNGTTISIPKFAANVQGNSVTYEIEYLGDGYGSIFTNSSATFTYTDIHTNEKVTANFYKPTVEVIPWTVDDHGVAELKTDLVMDIIANDLFEELTAGGYSVENYTITLTDANGNPTTYLNAVEQNGDDPSTYFDATLNTDNNTVTFYTETTGSYVYYYVVSADVVAPDGTTETVYSRVTPVDVVIPNVNLSKTAQEVTDNSTYSSYVVTDDYGNEQQLYLITLTAEKMNASDKIYNGVLTDVIPANFEFVKFVSPTSNTNLSHSNGTITWTNISSTSTTSTTVVTLQFLLRYTGDGYGTAYTNTSANFTYNFGSSTGPETTQYFPVPTAGLNPSTVNDVDIAHSGDTNTLNVLDNDLFDEDGFQLPNYPASDVTVYITDAEGNIIDDPEATYGMEITVNSDGTITYTAPETEGPVQFYYVVESTVTLPLDSSYAEDNSTTLISRPTMVTVYTITDKYLVVDFGYTTDGLSLLPDSDVIIDKAKNVSFKECITFSTPNTMGTHGNAAYATLTDDVTFAYTPGTTDFFSTDYFATSLATKNSIYISTARTVASGVTVIPANNVFYEEGFLNFGKTVEQTDENGDVMTDNEGNTIMVWNADGWQTETEENAETDRTQGTANIIYGYDDAYELGETYSGGSTKAVTVTKENYDKHAYFIFSGTGFDIFASCSTDTGVLIAEIYAFDDEADYNMGALQRVVLIDTYMDGGEDVVFDQLPVIMCRDLTYGRYTVRLRAYYNEIFDHNYVAQKSAVRKELGLSYDVPLEIQTLDPSKGVKSTRALPTAANGTYNVYIDSVRIYNPLNVVPTEVIANQAYNDANEINATFINIRDLILDADNWTEGQEGVTGVLYIADQRAGILNGGDAGTVEDDNTVPAPATSGFYLSPTGSLETVVEDGKTYLQDTSGNKAAYDGNSVYIVYIKDTDEGEEVLYVADESGEIDRIGYRYTDASGVEHALTLNQLKDANIIHYTSQYEAFGPKFEVHLQNGNGIAFELPSATTNVQISAKMADTGNAEIQAYYKDAESGVVDWYPVDAVTSRTEMYYDLTGCVYNGMLLVKCVSEDENAILSLCNLKMSGDSTGVMPTMGPKSLIRAAFAFAGKDVVVEDYAEELSMTGVNVDLASAIAINFNANASVFDQYTDVYAVFSAEGKEDVTVREYFTSGTGADLKYNYAYEGLTALDLGLTINVTVYGMRDGILYHGETKSYSVLKYCTTAMEKGGNDAVPCANLIMYGDAAQAFKGVAEEDRVLSMLTEEQTALLNQYAYADDALNVAKTSVVSNGTQIEFTSQNVDMLSKITMVYEISFANYTGSMDAVSIRVTYKDEEGNDAVKEYAIEDLTDLGDGIYELYFAEFYSTQMRELATCEIYIDGELHASYGNSLENYCYTTVNKASNSDAMKYLATRMSLYGDATYAAYAN